MHKLHMKGASAAGSGQQAAGSDAASRRALLVRCNLQIYAARSTHTRAYTIHTPYTHTYIVVMMHNQKLNSVPLAGTRPNGFCLSQKPFPPLGCICPPASPLGCLAASSNCNCCNVLFCKIFNLPDVQRWPNWKNTTLGMASAKW